MNVTDDLWQALGEAFSDAFGKSPIADELQRIADDYQRDAIAGAQSEEAFEANKREYSK